MIHKEECIRERKKTQNKIRRVRMGENQIKKRYERVRKRKRGRRERGRERIIFAKLYVCSEILAAKFILVRRGQS